VQPDGLDVAVGIDRIEAALEIDVRRVVRTWSGPRTFAQDRAPVVGFDAAADGFFWCSGQGGYGIQAAPAIARTSAAFAKREALPKDIVAQGVDASDLSPARFNL
jgi:D-arginine dehydrogenase